MMMFSATVRFGKGFTLCHPREAVSRNASASHYGLAALELVEASKAGWRPTLRLVRFSKNGRYGRTPCAARKRAMSSMTGAVWPGMPPKASRVSLWPSRG